VVLLFSGYGIERYEEAPEQTRKGRSAEGEWEEEGVKPQNETHNAGKWLG